MTFVNEAEFITSEFINNFKIIDKTLDFSKNKMDKKSNFIIKYLK